MKIKEKTFVKSSFSGGSNCVGVAIQKESISVINTKKKDVILNFTQDEWVAFIQGVKNGEFDIK